MTVPFKFHAIHLTAITQALQPVVLTFAEVNPRPTEFLHNTVSPRQVSGITCYRARCVIFMAAWSPSPTAVKDSFGVDRTTQFALPWLGRAVLVVALVCQTCACTLLMRAARSEVEFSTPLALAGGEALKLLVCVIMVASTDAAPASSLLSALSFGSMLPMSLPGLLYAVQNSLVYFASSHLPASMTAVLQQTKILTTAGFSYAMLGTSLSWRKWCALVMLCVGICLAQLGGDSRSASSDVAVSPTLGVLAILASTALSGFSSVFLERALKAGSASSSIWIRNIQLSICSLAACCMSVMLSPSPEHGSFSDFTPLVWLTVLNLSLGGILVAAVRDCVLVV